MSILCLVRRHGLHKIKVGRGNYYVEYSPARTDVTIAHLQLVFTSLPPKEEVAQLLEKEFTEWAKKYSALVFATAWDEKEDAIDLVEVRPAQQITGYYDSKADNLVMVWGLIPEKDAPEYDVANRDA